MVARWQGVVVGLSVAAPVGPMAVLCIRRSLAFGRPVGLATGAGAASVHALYTALAILGVKGLVTRLDDHATAVHLVSGLVLVALGVRMALRVSLRVTAERGGMSKRTAYVSAVGLCLANPLTVVSLASLLAGLRLTGSALAGDVVSLVAGVFVGSLMWWLLMTGLVASLARRLSDRGVGWSQRVSGLWVTAMGVAILCR